MRIPFIQDKSPIHGANIIKYWFENNPHFDLLPWPAKGADLYPITKWLRIANSSGLVLRMKFLTGLILLGMGTTQMLLIGESFLIR
jgi:hypothetical protein